MPGSAAKGDPPITLRAPVFALILNAEISPDTLFATYKYPLAGLCANATELAPVPNGDPGMDAIAPVLASEVSAETVDGLPAAFAVKT
jgi:hypothetical protein